MSQQQEPSARMRHAMETLDLTIKGCRVYGRDDLVQRLSGVRRLLSEPAVTVYVIGEFKQGKSSLINALLTTPVCPVDDDIATAVTTEVRYAGKSTAMAHYEPDGDDWGTGWAEPVSPADLASYVSEASNPGNLKRLRHVTVGVESEILVGGLVLVDTPGVGGLGSVHLANAASALPQAHAVLFVSDASQELTLPELKFLWTAEELCPTIFFVLTKIDLYPQWRRILELDIAHMRNSGFRPVEPIAVSSMLHTKARQTADPALDAESGFPRLVSALQRVVQDAEQVALHTAAHHMLAAIDQVETTLQSRKMALDHPERSEQLLTGLTGARERADRLRSKSARWQMVLLDGMADVASDIDFDIRSRIRMLLADAERAIDEGDPAANWDEFESWLRQRLATEALENYGLLVRGAREVGHRVGEHFELAESAIIPAEVKPLVPAVDEFDSDHSFAVSDKRVKSGLAGLQKGYMGFGLFYMLSHLASIALNPAVGIVAAAVMGRSGYREDRTRQLEKRRSQAKTAVRRFIDDVNLRLSKDSRDALRQVQRELRDGYTELAEELQRSMSEALSAAERAVKESESERREVKRMEADLRSLEMMRSRATKLMKRNPSLRGGRKRPDNPGTPPATMPPTAMSPATMSPATMSPAAMSPGTMSPATMSPAAMSPGTMRPGPER